MAALLRTFHRGTLYRSEPVFAGSGIVRARRWTTARLASVAAPRPRLVARWSSDADGHLVCTWSAEGDPD